MQQLYRFQHVTCIPSRFVSFVLSVILLFSICTALTPAFVEGAAARARAARGLPYMSPLERFRTVRAALITKKGFPPQALEEATVRKTKMTVEAAAAAAAAAAKRSNLLRGVQRGEPLRSAAWEKLHARKAEFARAPPTRHIPGGLKHDIPEKAKVIVSGKGFDNFVLYQKPFGNTPGKIYRFDEGYKTLRLTPGTLDIKTYTNGFVIKRRQHQDNWAEVMEFMFEESPVQVDTNKSIRELSASIQGQFTDHALPWKDISEFTEKSIAAKKSSIF